MRSFASDNNSGVHPLVMDALLRANKDHALGYGNDEWTNEAIVKVKEVFGFDCEPVFVFNGTGSNVIALQLMTRPYHSIICAETGHVNVDECGAPVKHTGCQMRPIATKDGKLTPELILPCLHTFGDQHHSQPGVIYLSQCTELGTIYTPEELRAISGLAHHYNMRVLMDGSRISNACAALNLSLPELTVDCGVDILSFGGTKNGLMMGECVVIFDSSLKAEARFVRKQTTQLASKMRYLSCQFTAYLTDDLWLKNAKRANEMAGKLYAILQTVPGVHFTQKRESNQLFLTMPRPVIDKLLQSYFFYFWNEKENEIRLVTSFDTTEEDIETFAEAITQ
ncbi:threonine aldolase [termite gut metagenome]|uniref:Threonine aldolase n=1 Tax=termite gut metagenome TaxID=433724 RepID=A0A5J4T0M5_9ZZZZ